MKRRWMAAAWLALGCLAPAIAARRRQVGLGGEWVSLFDGKTLGGWTLVPLPGKKTKLGGQGRRDRGLGRAVDALQPAGRLQELPVSAPRSRSTTRATPGMYIRTPKEADLHQGLRDPGQQHAHATRSRPARSTRWSTSRRCSSRPTPGSPRRSRSPTQLPGQDGDQDPDHGQRRAALRVPRPRPALEGRATSPSSSTTPAARSRSARSR